MQCPPREDDSSQHTADIYRNCQLFLASVIPVPCSRARGFYYLGVESLFVAERLSFVPQPRRVTSDTGIGGWHLIIQESFTHRRYVYPVTNARVEHIHVGKRSTKFTVGWVIVVLGTRAARSHIVP